MTGLPGGGSLGFGLVALAPTVALVPTSLAGLGALPTGLATAGIGHGMGPLLMGAAAGLIAAVMLRPPEGSRWRIAVLLIAVVLAGGLITVYAEETGSEAVADSHRSATQEAPAGVEGPGVSPGYIEAFYASFDPSQAQQVDDVVHEPADVPDPINERPAADSDPTVPELGNGPRVTNTTHEITLTVQERMAPFNASQSFYYWTYGEQVPGPILRVQEGDTVEFTLENEAGSNFRHSIDLHAVNGPGGGAKATQAGAGESKTFRFEAKNPGFYVYHCGTPNVPVHLANQMFGGIIVEPDEGLPAVDREFVVFQGEVYGNTSAQDRGFVPVDPDRILDEDPSHFTFNGRPHGVAGEHALEAKTGEEIRIYFGNGGISRDSAFHVIGEQFKRVWPEGSFGTDPWGPGVQTVSVAPGSSAVVDLELDEPGKYVLVDHALSRMDRGAWGVLNVE